MDAQNGKVEHREPVPYGTYVMVWLGLLCLTGVTITAAGLHFGRLSVIVALSVAAVKGSLVVAHFMRLKHEERFFKIMLLLTIATLAVIMILTFADTALR
ncbi:MAG: cytochrome C oxidase subunit IV family protein [Acidobacteria bacterium]|nr:cytochrome C oxidase subunit IV family protein [Acidobacteriota bacterium]